jgi:transglutaminase-like putative cysteine protease
VKKVNFEYQTEHSFHSPVTEHKFLLKILPADDSRQLIESLAWRIGPRAVFWMTSAGFGNSALAGYVDVPHTGFQFGITGTAEVSDEPYMVCPEPQRVLLYPSELTHPDPAITAFYQQLEANAPKKILPRILHFSHAVHEHMLYERGITSNTSTASEAFTAKAGVCQDYTHILLALLRLDNIPSRYVAGLASDYGETHAWVEAWAEGKYYGVDPTRDKLIDEFYIALSRGRDFNDCSVERGVYKGKHGGTQSVYVSMEVA